VLHGPLNAAEAEYAKATGVRPVINSLAQARRWCEAGGGVCDLMVDTAMNRLGVGLAELGDEVLRALDIDVLHSHLVSAEQDLPLNALQRRRWEEARRELPHRRGSLANSAGITLGPDFHGDLTRPGLSLYGGVTRAALAAHIRQVARPQAALIQTRNLAAGESVGYDGTFTARREMRIGTVALGYADGYLVCWSEIGAMLHAGRRLPVLGRVSMDMTVIDLTAAPDLAEGDWVEVEYTLAAAAGASGLSQYELLTSLGGRFAR
jgi:alanine racemase